MDNTKKKNRRLRRVLIGIAGIVSGCLLLPLAFYVVGIVIANGAAESDYYPLGDHYYYFIDPEEYMIVYREYHYTWIYYFEDEYEELLQGYLIKYGSNKDYLILWTKSLKSAENEYWLITKEDRNVIHFGDSTALFNELKVRGSPHLKFNRKPYSVATNKRYE